MKKTSHSKRILLDMDGVLVDFTKGACEIHGRHNYIPSTYDFFKHEWGMSSKEFWSKIDAEPHFWENLDKLPWADDLINYLHKNKYEFTISTAPSLSKYAPSGKVAWLRKHIHKNFYDYQLGPKKFLMANPNHLLIDDNEKYYNDFIQYGGQAILFPDYTNSNKHIRSKDEILAYVTTRIEKFYSSEAL